jgi:hypothetical protein
MLIAYLYYIKLSIRESVESQAVELTNKVKFIASKMVDMVV